MKGSCKSLVELEYFLEEFCKATTDQLDWNNPEGQQYPHDLRKPLPLIHNSRGRRVIPFDHFINNDLAYLSGRVSIQTYATLVTKTKAADYGHIKWIEDLVPNTMESARDVYSRNRIIRIKKLMIVKWHNYKHLESITIRKLKNLNIEERLTLGVSLQMFTRSIVLRRRVEDLQLGVEIYQKKLNLTKPENPDAVFTTDNLERAGNPIKEILLKLNLPDHRLILKDSKILKDEGEEFVCTKGDDGDVMFTEIVKKNNDSCNEEPKAGGLEVEYFDIFPTRRKPFIEISNMTLDPLEGVVRFTKGTNEVAYKMPQKIEQYNSLSDLEKEHTKSVYLRNEEDKRKGAEYAMSKILGFYKEFLELGPEYVTKLDDEGEVTLYLTRRSLEALRKFHWTILRG
ncbi:hypothetical protein Tco_1179254 [Tanacetum coccineum]